MVSESTSLHTKSLYGVWMVSIVLLWDMAIATLIGNDKVKAELGHWINRIEKFSGVMLMSCAVIMLVQ